MKKYFIISVFLLSGLLTLHAQSNYSPGYVITNEKDTLKGFIDYRTDKMNARFCKFKPSLSVKEHTYYPGDIVGFRFTEIGKYFVSRTVTINNIQSTVFLEYLLQGIMNLYFYQNDADESCYYFFENEKGEMLPVTKKPNDITKNDDGSLTENGDDKYKEDIKNIFQNYEIIKRNAFVTQFTHKDMIGLAKDYHNLVCTSGESCIVFETKADKPFFKTEFSVYSGVDISPFLNKYYTKSGNPWRKGVSPTIGGQFNISVPRWFKSLSLQFDFSLTKMHSEKNESFPEGSLLNFRTIRNDGSFSTYNYGMGNIINSLKYKYDAYRVAGNLGIKYTFYKWKFHPILEAGAIAYNIFSEKEKLVITSPSINNGPETTNTFNFVNFKTVLNTSYYAGVGIDYPLANNHAIILRVDREIREYTNAWQIKVGYTL